MLIDDARQAFGARPGAIIRSSSPVQGYVRPTPGRETDSDGSISPDDIVE